MKGIIPKHLGVIKALELLLAVTMRLSISVSSFAFAAFLWSAATNASASAQNVDAVDTTSSTFLRRAHNEYGAAAAADYDAAPLSVDDVTSHHRGLASGSGSKRSKSTSTSDVTASLAFAMTNAAGGNAIVVYNRDVQTGQLAYSGDTVGTGGLGGILPVLTNVTGANDPLASQDSLVVTGNCLLAANPGSSTVSSFRIEADNGALGLAGNAPISVVPSGGTFPVSIAVEDGPSSSSFGQRSTGRSGDSSRASSSSKSKSDTTKNVNFVYVGNAGGPAPADTTNPSSAPNMNGGNIAGFTLDRMCNLEPIAGSEISLGQKVYFPAGRINPDYELRQEGNGILPFFASSLAQISFTPDGKEVLAVLKSPDNDSVGSGVIIRFKINGGGTLTEFSRVNSNDAAGGTSTTPFSFTFDEEGNLLNLEAFGDSGVAFTPNAGRVRSYALEDNGDLTPLSFANTGFTDTCWVQYNPVNSCAYTTNNGGQSTSAIAVGNDGVLTLDEGVLDSLNENDFPIDLRFSSDYHFLYVLESGYTGPGNDGQPTITVYEVAGSNCWLRERQAITDGLPRIATTVNGVVGLAVYDFCG